MAVAELWTDCQTDEPPNSWSRCVMVLLVKTQCSHYVKYVLNYITCILNIRFSAFNCILVVGILFILIFDLGSLGPPFGQKLNTDLALLKIPCLSSLLQTEWMKMCGTNLLWFGRLPLLNDSTSFSRQCQSPLLKYIHCCIQGRRFFI